MYFEQKEYKKCIEQCNKAIEVGRENRADFKLISKAFTRIGNAHLKLGVSHIMFIYQILRENVRKVSDLIITFREFCNSDVL